MYTHVHGSSCHSTCKSTSELQHAVATQLHAVLTHSFICATISSSSSTALLAVTGRDRPFVNRFGVFGNVSLLLKITVEVVVWLLFPLLDEEVE